MFWVVNRCDEGIHLNNLNPLGGDGVPKCRKLWIEMQGDG